MLAQRMARLLPPKAVWRLRPRSQQHTKKTPSVHRPGNPRKCRGRRHLSGRNHRPNNEDRTLLNQAANRMKLSARGYHRILRVARTLADIDGQDNVRRLHIAEALSYHQVAPG